METLIPAVSSLVSTVVPIKSMMVRMHAGMLVGELLRYCSKTTNTSSSWIPSVFKSNKLFISQVMSDERHSNPVFDQMQEYIISKHFQKLDSAQLIPKKGEITLFPKRGLSLKETFQGKPLEISITFAASDEGNPDSSKSNSHNQIVISSRKLSVEQLKEFVQNICKIDRVLHSTIEVYRPLVVKGKREESVFVDWDKIFMKTNKTLDNTIYSDEVMKTLFNDVDWFINNEEWYRSRGMSYKRGYILHGPPGSGKTSVAKIIANKYHLPIFVLDLQSIENNSDFTKLVTEINYLTDKRYIISIEDLDRTDMFKNKYYGENPKCVSIQCFLNFLDGVVETHGRICIFSANDMNILDSHPSSNAMFRPGRIDCKVEITNCTKTQLVKLFHLFYNEDLTEESIKTTSNISPAQFINIMTKCTKEEVIQYLTSEKSKVESDSDITINGLLGTGNTEKGKGQTKCTKKRGHCSRHATPLMRLKRKQKELDRMEKVIQQSIKRSDKLREDLIIQGEKISNEKISTSLKEKNLKRKEENSGYESEGLEVVQSNPQKLKLRKTK
jgi:SpoVK/Ycf46/Vps4 family AAA+-type ATPase